MTEPAEGLAGAGRRPEAPACLGCGTTSRLGSAELTLAITYPGLPTDPAPPLKIFLCPTCASNTRQQFAELRRVYTGAA